MAEKGEWETQEMMLWASGNYQEEDYRTVQRIARMEKENPCETSEHWDEEETLSFSIAARLKELHERKAEGLSVQNTVYGTLLTGALSSVNWEEIGHTIASQVLEDGNW